MKPEEKYLDQLFESARAEEPHTSLETVSETFLSATSPTGFVFVKELLLKNFSLNSIILLMVGTAAIFSIWLGASSSSLDSENKIYSTPVTSLPIESSPKKELSTAIEKPNVISNSMENTISSFSKNKKESAANINLEKGNKTDLENQMVKPIQKIDVPASPKISGTPLALEEFKTEIKPKIAIENLAQMESVQPKPRKSSEIKTTRFSPWVANGSGGTTHVDWSIEQSQTVKKVTQDERILQKIMNAEYLKTIFEKDENGNFIPVTLVSNYFFDEQVYLEFNEEKIRVLNQISNDSKPFINITKYKVKKKRAYLEFDYKGEKVKFQLKKYNQIWKYHKLETKDNSGKKIDITF